ncbi:MAG: hypothetical protein DWQ34_22400 [Planctomycetota bacterium]|nr:MAG: hypothetical protein DWQ29_13410 [Planctomycetota bacterium]REJ88342.1 MAG: hypothetical protein DWQ34_22400 [Planctomycetota bacterium]REK30696.1 MAG: hypothetical protein DWQ41_01745 [Planctomycetota bacterium]REK33071.1 MAG: hypothetical protein DWQ45_15850 [Planctomycetota bacterium]
MTISSRRQLLATGAATLLGASVGTSALFAQQTKRVPGQLTEEQLGQMIAALGIKPDKQEQRYDFAFRAKMGEDEWELSMSAVLSQDEKSIWIMAWLDPMPESAAEVPRNALLRLLAENDRIGNGKFFAYIPANRRFVLEKTMPNENMTSAKFKVALQDLGTSVVDTYGVWSVTNWNKKPDDDKTAASGDASAEKPLQRSADNSSRFDQPVRR